jgi:hypothetical protein
MIAEKSDRRVTVVITATTDAAAPNSEEDILLSPSWR